MKIAGIEVYIVKIPPAQPPAAAGKRFLTDNYFTHEGKRSCIYSTHLETVLVKATTDEGVSGWGEVLAPTHPEVAAALLKHHLAPLALGEDPLSTQYLWDKILDTLRERGYGGGYLVDAMAGLDIACWDIKGKALGLPVHTLLGGPCRSKLRCYISGVPGDTTAERLESVARLVGEGFDAFKIHTLGQGKSADLALLQAIRRQYDADRLALMYDAHGKPDLTEAYAIGRSLGELDALFFESPLVFEDREGHRKLAEAIDTAVAVGEPLRTIYAFKDWITGGAAEVVQPDMGRNGITEMMRIAHLAEACHVPFAPHLSAHQAVGHAASIQVAAAAPNFLIYEYQPDALRASASYADVSFRLERGHLLAGNEPGLGVTIDEPALRKQTTEYFAVRGDGKR